MAFQLHRRVLCTHLKGTGFYATYNTARCHCGTEKLSSLKGLQRTHAMPDDTSVMLEKRCHEAPRCVSARESYWILMTVVICVTQMWHNPSEDCESSPLGTVVGAVALRHSRGTLTFDAVTPLPRQLPDIAKNTRQTAVDFLPATAVYTLQLILAER